MICAKCILKKFRVRPAALRDPAHNIERKAGRVFPFNTVATFCLTWLACGTQPRGLHSF